MEGLGAQNSQAMIIDPEASKPKTLITPLPEPKPIDIIYTPGISDEIAKLGQLEGFSLPSFDMPRAFITPLPKPVSWDELILTKDYSIDHWDVKPADIKLTEADSLSNSNFVEIKNKVLESERVGSALKQDPYHGFNNIIDNYADSAAKFDIATKGPGGEVLRKSKLFQIKGSLDGKSGIFEWILDQDKVTHRRFIPGGKITGYPNQK